MTNRPSVDLLTLELAKTRKVVTFNSRLPAESIHELLKKSTCGVGVVRMTTMASAGPGLFFPVTSSVTFTLEHGNYPDGRLWSFLRLDGVLHLAASGVVITPSTTGSSIQVIRAIPAKVAFIKAKVEDGTVFCHWREFVNE